MIIKKRISIVLLLTIFLNLSVLYFTKPACAIEMNYATKISPGTYELSERDGDRYLVYLWRKSVDKETVDRVLRDKGVEVDAFQSSKVYNKTRAQEIERLAVEIYGADVAYSPSEKAISCGETATVLEDMIRDDYKEYISMRRSVTKELCNAEIDRFVSENAVKYENIKYRGYYTGTLVLSATEDEIKRYSRDDSVTEISPYVKGEVKSDITFTNGQINTDDINGTKSSYYNDGNGYTGYGVNIGVIESGGKYDVNFPQLAGSSLVFITNIWNGDEVEYEITDHASMVTSIIVGKQKTVNGKKYEGVAPNAHVFQTQCSCDLDFYNAFQFLADAGVSIINFSAGVNYRPESGIDNFSYTPCDREADRLISQSDVTFVCAAGNSSTYVNAPGKAYGAVTVGSLNTKSGSLIVNTPPYSMASSSSYDANTGITNKPDICAPGVNVSVVGYSNVLMTKSGTSFATPHVSGLAAHLHQSDNDCLVDPILTKTLLILGASNNNIVTTGNGTSGNSYLRSKSGAGLVNAVKSMDAIDIWSCDSQQVNLSTATAWENIDEMYLWLNSGDKVRIVMTFDKCDNSVIGVSGYRNDVDLYIRKASGGYFLASSVSEINNVEIIEYTATETTMYKIEVELYSFVYDYLTTSPLRVAVAWFVY